MKRLFTVALLIFLSPFAQADNLYYPGTSSYVTLKATAPDGSSSTVMISPTFHKDGEAFVGSDKFFFLNKWSNNLEIIEIKVAMEYQAMGFTDLDGGSLQKQNIVVPTIRIESWGYKVKTQSFAEPTAGGFITSVASLEGQVGESLAGIKVRVEKIVDRGINQAIEPQNQTFRATPAQAKCFLIRDMKSCLDQEEGK